MNQPKVTVSVSAGLPDGSFLKIYEDESIAVENPIEIVRAVNIARERAGARLELATRAALSLPA